METHEDRPDHGAKDPEVDALLQRLEQRAAEAMAAGRARGEKAMSAPTLTLAVAAGPPPTVPIVAALGGLALHVDAWRDRLWTISHRPTGRRVLTCCNLRDGLVALDALNQPGVDWWGLTGQTVAPPEHRAAWGRARAACMEGAW
jgi:hypothetical protein